MAPAEAAAVECPQCGRANRHDARFCDGCGQRLNDAAQPAVTPEHLAEKIRRQRPSEGERRIVTVLFVDTVGSTPLAEKLGEEAMYSLMREALARMSDAVHHYEGYVATFTGDGLMALFGAPIAHEDSPRRAVSAALRMQTSLEEYGAEIERRHGIGCRFRVGLNTGPVVVGTMAEDLRMDFTAIGDTVNLAGCRRLLRLRGPRGTRNQGKGGAESGLAGDPGKRNAHPLPGGDRARPVSAGGTRSGTVFAH